jgi:hypothetical protein
MDEINGMENQTIWMKLLTHIICSIWMKLGINEYEHDKWEEMYG